jgi:AraC-like DNA-binding protein
MTNRTQTKQNMQEVANASGFKSTSTFNPVFKRVAWLTSTGYKINVKARIL